MLRLVKMPLLLREAIKRLSWNQQKIRAYQDKKLRQIVRHAYNNNSFYHKKFEEKGIYPEEIKTIDDINMLPIIKKDELRYSNVEHILSRGFSTKPLRTLKTSGSTGKPFKLFLTGSEDNWRKAIYLRANVYCGQKIRDKWVFITSPGHFGDTTKIQKLLNIYAQKCISVFDDVSIQIKKVRDYNPNIIDGYSSSIFLLAKEIETSGITNINPRLLFGNAEVIDENSIKFIEKIFKAPYYDQYGSVELNRTAWQCPEKMGYHLDVDSVITQFIDDDGDEVAPGERGNLVLTSLFNYAIPFIRYDIGDVGVPSDEMCSCGIALPLMKSIEGRSDSFVVFPGNRVLSPRTLTISMSLFKNYDMIEQFRIIQKEINLIEILIKLKKTSYDRKNFEQELKQHLRNLLNIQNQEVIFDINFVDHIELNKGGKLMAVKSELKRTHTLSGASP